MRLIGESVGGTIFRLTTLSAVGLTALTGCGDGGFFDRTTKGVQQCDGVSVGFSGGSIIVTAELSGSGVPLENPVTEARVTFNRTDEAGQTDVGGSQAGTSVTIAIPSGHGQASFDRASATVKADNGSDECPAHNAMGPQQTQMPELPPALAATAFYGPTGRAFQPLS